ncbi:MAG: hypothetical protein WBA93_30300 [Microcoleaceae cyanobacterium]
MLENYHNSPTQDTGKSRVFSTIAKAELSPFLKNLSIAALLGVIALTVISSLVVAASRNYLDENNNLETKQTSFTI